MPRPDVAGGRRRGPAYRKPLVRKIRSCAVQRRTRPERGLLIRHAGVPPAVTGVLEGDDERRRLAGSERRVGTLGGPARVVADIKRRRGPAGVDDPAEVRGPIPPVHGARPVPAADADGVILGIHEDGVVRGTADPACQDIGGRRVSGREVLAGPRAECRVPGVGHALRRRSAILRRVGEVAVHGHVRGHPLRRGGERVGNGESRQTARRAELVQSPDELELRGIQARSVGHRRRQQARQPHDRKHARCDNTRQTHGPSLPRDS